MDIRWLFRSISLHVSVLLLILEQASSFYSSDNTNVNLSDAYLQLIDSLQRTGILAAEEVSPCVEIQDILLQRRGSDGHRAPEMTVRIHLRHFPSDLGDVTSGEAKRRVYDSNNGSIYVGKCDHVLVQAPPSITAGRLTQLPHRVSRTDISGLPLVSLDMKMSATAASDDSRNLTDDSGTAAIGATGDHSESDSAKPGLSKTQVVVIVTCSAVIGTFFTIAGALRIHSCVRRYQANREAALTLARRSSTHGFSGALNPRRDSAASKLSRQSQPLLKGGSPSSLPSPSLRDPSGELAPFLCMPPPHVSCQHARWLASKENASSHGSIAFIDEECPSKGDIHVRPNHRPKDDSLLHDTPMSGTESTVDVALENAYPFPEELVAEREKSRTVSSAGSSRKESVVSLSRTAASRSASLASPQRVEVFEPGGESDFERDMPSDYSNASSARDNDVNDVSGRDEKPGVIEPMFSLIGDNCVVDVSNTQQRHCDSSVLTGLPPLLPAKCLAATTGLSQSNDSLSDTPSYNYANQTSYNIYGIYRNYVYDVTDSSCVCGSASRRPGPPYRNPSQIQSSISKAAAHSFEYFEPNHPAEKALLSRMQSIDSYFRPTGRIDAPTLGQDSVVPRDAGNCLQDAAPQIIGSPFQMDL